MIVGNLFISILMQLPNGTIFLRLIMPFSIEIASYLLSCLTGALTEVGIIPDSCTRIYTHGWIFIRYKSPKGLYLGYCSTFDLIAANMIKRRKILCIVHVHFHFSIFNFRWSSSAQFLTYMIENYIHI